MCEERKRDLWQSSQESRPWPSSPASRAASGMPDLHQRFHCLAPRWQRRSCSHAVSLCIKEDEEEWAERSATKILPKLEVDLLVQFASSPGFTDYFSEIAQNFFGSIRASLWLWGSFLVPERRSGRAVLKVLGREWETTLLPSSWGAETDVYGKKNGVVYQLFVAMPAGVLFWKNSELLKKNNQWTMTIPWEREWLHKFFPNNYWCVTGVCVIGYHFPEHYCCVIAFLRYHRGKTSRHQRYTRITQINSATIKAV